MRIFPLLVSLAIVILLSTLERNPVFPMPPEPLDSPLETSDAIDETEERKEPCPLFSDSYQLVGEGQESRLSLEDIKMLSDLEEVHFNYFRDNTNAASGLTLDRSTKDSPASIAATGFALTAFAIGAERGWITRDEASTYCLNTLKTLSNTAQGEDPETTSGKHGFFFHFLNPEDGTRSGKSEISTIDTALLMSGVLFAKSYYDGDSEKEGQIRELAKNLYERVDWPKALTDDGKLSHGWMPESGMIPHVWSAYDEGTVLMLMAAGSPTHPISSDVVDKYYEGAKRTNIYGQDHISFGPLFGHQYAHSWVDFRGISNGATKPIGIDLFENSRRATLAQNYYAQDNPNGFTGYGKLDWGLTACDGPGWESKTIDGKERQFYGYIARGFPDAPDDGTIAPTAAASSLPFAPDVVLPTLRHWTTNRKELLGPYGFHDSFNMTYDQSKPSGWVASDTIGIDQGAILLSIENYRSEFVWNTMKRSPEVRAGLKEAGFKGAWLDKEEPVK